MVFLRVSMRSPARRVSRSQRATSALSALSVRAYPCWGHSRAEATESHPSPRRTEPRSDFRLLLLLCPPILHAHVKTPDCCRACTGDRSSSLPILPITCIGRVSSSGLVFRIARLSRHIVIIMIDVTFSPTLPRAKALGTRHKTLLARKAAKRHGARFAFASCCLSSDTIQTVASASPQHRRQYHISPSTPPSILSKPASLPCPLSLARSRTRLLGLWKPRAGPALNAKRGGYH